MKVIDMAKFYFEQYNTIQVTEDYAMGLRPRKKVYESLEEFLADWEGWTDLEVIYLCFQTIYTGYSQELGTFIPDGNCEVPHLYFRYTDKIKNKG